MYKEICEKIKTYDKIIILRHQNPDGDALGSQIGLKEAIIKTFPDKKVLIGGNDNQKYSFLGIMDKINDSDFQGALVIVLDTSTTDIIDDERYKTGDFIIKIDHHKSGYPYGDINFVCDNVISCALLIADLVFTNQWELTDLGAMALFTGIVTDSGRFRYAGVNAKTFAICAKLLEYHFNINDVYNYLYVEDIRLVKLRAQMTLKFKQNGKLAYLKSTYQDVMESGFDVFTISRGMVGVMGGISGIEIWVNFTENENGQVLAEIRSNNIDVSNVALQFGGGGHKLASGATLKNFQEAELMLQTLQQLLENNNG